MLPDRYAHLEFNSPLSAARASGLVGSVAGAVDGGAPRVLDLGCGWGALLLRLVEGVEGAIGVGVDTDEALLGRGRADAGRRGLGGRVSFVAGDAAAWREPADVVCCIGADHAFGSLPDALVAVAGLTSQVAIVGTGFAEGSAPAAAPFDLGAMPSLAEVVAAAGAAGLRVLDVQTAGADEWEAFESGYLRGPELWLRAHPDDPEAAAVAAAVDEHRRGWLEGYRGVLGFAYLVCWRPPVSW